MNLSKAFEVLGTLVLKQLKPSECETSKWFGQTC